MCATALRISAAFDSGRAIRFLPEQCAPGLLPFGPRIGPFVSDDPISLQAKGIAVMDIIGFGYPNRQTFAGAPDKVTAHSLGITDGLAESLAIVPS